MQVKLFRQQYIYITGLLLLAAGLPISYFLTSVSQFFLAAAFLFEGKVSDKFKRFASNPTALVFTGIFLVHVIGMLWTTDSGEGIHDLRIKLPLLILPLMLAGSAPLRKKHFHWVLLAFVGSVLLASLIIYAVIAGIIDRPIRDVHEAFIFKISHIRFALFVCLSIFIINYLAFRESTKPMVRIGSVLLSVWFVFFLVKSEAITGLAILLAVALFFLCYLAFVRSSWMWRTVILSLLIAVPVLIVNWVADIHREVVSRKPVVFDPADKTAKGNSYLFDLSDSTVENGYRMWMYVNEDELRDAWNSRSSIKYDSLDQRKQLMRFTLIRYLTSKGWRKDAEAVMALSNDEVISIEKGVANVDYRSTSSLRARVKQVVWEFDKYRHGANPSGHSVTQRLEFWKAAIGIIERNFWIGVGTGDLKTAYKEEYERNGTRLEEEFRHRAHNQFLSIQAAFGVFGSLFFLFALLYPLRKKQHPLFYVFMLILLLSMLTEDTLETQPGATFAALFFSLFLFVPEKKTEALSPSHGQEGSH